MTTFSSMLSANWEIDSEAQAKAAAKQVTPPYNPFMARTIFPPYSWLMENPIGIMLLFIRHPSACCIQIFYNVAEPGKTSLSLQNFVEMLPEDKAMKAFALFEVSDEGTISKKALVKWVVNVYKERKALSLTLSDNRTVVAKLHRVLDVVGQFNSIPRTSNAIYR
jgi:hypothetical protein